MDAALRPPPPPEPKALLRGHRAPVNCLSFLYGSNESLVSGDANGDILIWSVKARRVIKSLPEEHTGGVLSVSSSPNGNKWLSQGRIDGTVKLWLEHDLIDVVRTNSESFCKAAVLWKEDSKGLILACTNDQESTIAVWDIKGESDGVGSPCYLLQPSADEKWGMVMDVRLVEFREKIFGVIVYEDCMLRVFDILECRLIPEMTLRVHPDLMPPTSFVLSNFDSEYCLNGLAGGASTELASFKLDFENLVGTFVKYVPAFQQQPSTAKTSGDDGSGLGRGVGQICLRADNRIIAVASWDHRVRVLHFRTLKHLAVLKYHRASVHSVCFSADCTLLASGSKDQNIAIWSIYPPND